MIYIISGTNRPASRTRQVAELVSNKIKKHNPNVEIIDLALLPFKELTGAQYGGKDLHDDMTAAIEKINTADGLVIVTPEYNGSMPGALKYFMDHWSYPRSFEFRPVAFIGLGFRWGGLRPVEHLQQIFNYRNAFAYPERVFISNVADVLKDGAIGDATINELLEKQAHGFVKFILALKSQNLAAPTTPPK
jgi:chromate reductase, NAD(P)H dehydrogenase (quinone)